jgi:hypothetical protein
MLRSLLALVLVGVLGTSCSGGGAEQPSEVDTGAGPLGDAGSSICASGTRGADDTCQSLICTPAQASWSGACPPLPVVDVAVPLAYGTTSTIAQGYDGSLSHKNNSFFAIDFGVPIGTPVYAARAGIVRDVRSDSTFHCGDPSCSDDANYVVVDHGDGTFAEYYHLSAGSVLVKAGESVCLGEQLGASGITGFTTGPHLHFAVRDGLTQSLPLRFNGVSGGILAPGMTVTSTLQPKPGCSATKPTICRRDLFAIWGVELTSDVPCSLVEFGHDYAILGHAIVHGGRVVLGIWSDVTGKWTNVCVETDASGNFSTHWTWNSGAYNSRSGLMVVAANLDCAFAGTASSVPIRVVPGGILH